MFKWLTDTTICENIHLKIEKMPFFTNIRTKLLLKDSGAILDLKLNGIHIITMQWKENGVFG